MNKRQLKKNRKNRYCATCAYCNPYNYGNMFCERKIPCDNSTLSKWKSRGAK